MSSDELTAAPAGFEFDHLEVASEAIAAFKVAAPELEVVLDELCGFAELDEDRIPTVTVVHSSGRTVGTLKLDWRRVGTVAPTENGS